MPIHPRRSFSLSFLVALLVWLPVLSLVKAQDVRINELMPSNVATLADEDGDFSDWIELYNAGAESVALAGYGLSDDAADPFKWMMPDLTLGPREHTLVFASDKDRANVAGHWESLIHQGDVWSYRVNTQPPPEWNTPGFDAAAWSSGPSGIGYGDGDDATEVPRGSLVVFARTTFTVDDPAQVERAVMHIDFDDGFVAYLNGVEFARANVSGSAPGTGRAADLDHEAMNYRGLPLKSYEIADVTALLQPGENVLAVQVHNLAANSSDLTLIPILTMGLQTPPSTPRGVSDLAASLADQHPHTNFQLSADGETLILTAPDSTRLDEIDYPSLAPNVSFGRSPDAGGAWVFFETSTPNAPNASDGFVGIAAMPKFSEPPGRYDQSAVTVALDAGDAAFEIRYSVDGSEPTEASPRYVQPLTVTATTVVRARAFAPGYLPSPIVTGTYLLREATSLPVVAIATDPTNLWDYETGIYVLGPNAEPSNPRYGANFWQEWEIPVHLELIEPDDATPALSVGAGARIFGGWSRAHPQKSLALFARGSYGADAFKYALLPEKPIDSYQSFVLRNGGNDWSYTLFRDAMLQSLMKDTGVDLLGYRPAVVFINGEYWGIQNIREKINEHYVAANHPGVDPDEIDMLEILRPPAEYGIIHGSDEHFQGLLEYVQTHPMTSETDFAAVERLMDVDEFIDYQIAQIYYANTDWPGNNLKVWRPHIPGGRWRWILYDTDFGFGIYDNNYSHETLAFATATNGPEWPNPPHSTLLFRRLLLNPTFRTAFINRFADHLNTTFQRARVTGIINEMADAIRDEVPRHSARWDGVLGNWDSQVERMRTFGERRSAPMWLQLRSFFGISREVPITVDAAPAGAGTVRINRLNLDAFPWQGSYFPAEPVTLEAVPAPGYRFAGWSGGAVSADPVLSVHPSRGLVLQASFEASSTAAGVAVINEIQYNPPDDMDTEDWIELYNPDDATLDLSGWIFMDDDSTHTFTLPGGTQMTAGSYVVLCRDAIAFGSMHPDVQCMGPWGDFGLGGGGDVVRLYDAAGVLVDSVAFDDDAPWPAEADGAGATLELADANSDNSLAESWVASSVRGGTPGAANSITVSAEPATSGPAAAFALHPNHPNPFRDATTIQYELDRPGRTVIRVFDVLGREVRTLVDAVQGPGVFTINFDARDLASGIYVCRLETPERSRTRTLLLMK